MWKLFQSVVWALTMWLGFSVQTRQDFDFFATFILGGIVAFMATQLVNSLCIAASRVLAAHRLLLTKQTHEPARRERRLLPPQY